MIPTRLPTDWPDVCRSVGIQRIHVDPGWQSDQRARLDRTFRPIGVAWHHDGIPPGHRTIERWVTEHTTGGRWGTTTYIMCIWPDGTLIIHGCRWSVNTGLSVRKALQCIQNGQPIPPYPTGPTGVSSVNTNGMFYGVVLHGGTYDGRTLANTFTRQQLDTADKLTRAWASIGVPWWAHAEHRQLSRDRKPDQFWGDRDIATVAAAQASQGDDDLTPDQEAKLDRAAAAWDLLQMWLDPTTNQTALSNQLRAGAKNAADAEKAANAARTAALQAKAAAQGIDPGAIDYGRLADLVLDRMSQRLET